MPKISQFQAAMVNAVASTLYMFTFGLVVSLLVFYLMNHLGQSKDEAYCYFSAFLSLFFCLAVAGGSLGQKTGYWNSALIGGLFMTTGLLTIGLFNKISFGLGTYVVGCGLYVPNKAVCLGQVYNPSDNKRSIAFTLSYFVMNLGAALGGIFSGTILKDFGYAGVFNFAAIGVFSSAIIFLSFCQFFPFIENSQCKLQLSSSKLYQNLLASFLVGIILIIFSVNLLSHPEFDRGLVIIIAIAIISYILFLSYYSTNLKKQDRQNVRLFLLMCSLLVIFWSLYDLEPTALLVFIKAHVDRVIFHYTVPASDFFSLDPAIVFGVGLILYLFFKDSVIYKLKTVNKLLIGVFFCGLALLTLFYIENIAQTHFISISWILLVYLFISCGEILVGPTGSAMVGELSPKHMHGFLMGFCRFVSGFSAIISGYLAIGTTNSVILPNHIVLAGTHYLIYALTVFAFLFVFFISRKSILRFNKHESAWN